METISVPDSVREKLGDAGSDGLLTMFAEAHRLSTESFEQRLTAFEQRMDRRFDAIDRRFDAIDRRFVDVDHKFDVFGERFERRLAEETGRLRFDLIKWSFLFWIGQLAGLTAILSVLVSR
jgi:hypothetical protein